MSIFRCCCDTLTPWARVRDCKRISHGSGALVTRVKLATLTIGHGLDGRRHRCNHAHCGIDHGDNAAAAAGCRSARATTRRLPTCTGRAGTLGRSNSSAALAGRTSLSSSRRQRGVRMRRLLNCYVGRSWSRTTLILRTTRRSGELFNILTSSLEGEPLQMLSTVARRGSRSVWTR